MSGADEVHGALPAHPRRDGPAPPFLLLAVFTRVPLFGLFLLFSGHFLSVPVVFAPFPERPVSEHSGCVLAVFTRFPKCSCCFRAF